MGKPTYGQSDSINFHYRISRGWPISSIVVSMTSCRVAHSIGGILCFLSFTLSFFADNLDLLVLTYGLIGGIGTSLMAAPSIIVLGYSFDHYQGIAVGFAVAGAGLGMFISGPVTQSLLNHYGLHGTFLIMGGISSHGFALGLLMRPSELEIRQKIIRKQHEEKSEEEKSSRACAKRFIPSELLRNKIFWFLLIATLFWNVAYSIMLLHLPNFAVSVGAPETEGAFLITMVGLGSVVNRLLTGLSLSKGSGFDPFLLEFGFLVLAGIVTITFPLVSYSWAGREIFSVLFGIYSGGLITLFTPICVYLLGVGQLTAGIGGLYLASGIGYIIGPPLAGFMVDSLGTYEHSFYMSGSLLLLSSIVVLASSKWLREVEEQRTTEESQVLDITRAEIISGSSLFLSGSFNYIIEVEKHSLKHTSKRSLLCDEERAITRGEPPLRCDIDISNGILRFAEVEEGTNKDTSDIQNISGVPSIVISPLSNKEHDSTATPNVNFDPGMSEIGGDIDKRESRDSTLEVECNLESHKSSKMDSTLGADCNSESHKNVNISEASVHIKDESGRMDESQIYSNIPRANNENILVPTDDLESDLKLTSSAELNNCDSSKLADPYCLDITKATELSASDVNDDNKSFTDLSLPEPTSISCSNINLPKEVVPNAMSSLNDKYSSDEDSKESYPGVLRDDCIINKDHRVIKGCDFASSNLPFALEIPESGDLRADDFTETDVFLIKVK